MSRVSHYITILCSLLIFNTLFSNASTIPSQQNEEELQLKDLERLAGYFISLDYPAGVVCVKSTFIPNEGLIGIKVAAGKDDWVPAGQITFILTPTETKMQLSYSPHYASTRFQSDFTRSIKTWNKLVISHNGYDTTFIRSSFECGFSHTNITFINQLQEMINFHSERYTNIFNKENGQKQTTHEEIRKEEPITLSPKFQTPSPESESKVDVSTTILVNIFVIAISTLSTGLALAIITQIC